MSEIPALDPTGLPAMTDAETIAYLRFWANGGGSHGLWAWPTDPCGYDQHIRFVRYRNQNWDSFAGSFEDFVRQYANELERATNPTTRGGDAR
jgi:hypothetical protein